MNRFQKFHHFIDRIFNPFRDIEIFGMYGPGNLGDEAMLVAAQMHLPDRRCTSYQSYLERPALKRVVRERPLKHLLVAGGTLIHGGKTGWLDYVEMRSRQGVRVSFLGTGLAFLDEQVEQRSDAFKRWSDVLHKSSDIHLRGPQSAELARVMCGRGEIFGDFAFLLHREDLALDCHDRRTAEIGVNVGECLGDQDDFEEKIRLILDYVSRDFFIVFHAVFGTDIPVIERVIKKSGLAPDKFRIEKNFFDPIMFMRRIRTYRGFIGLKLHAAGLAMICGVPTVMISYLPKCQDFFAPLSNVKNCILNLPLDLDFSLKTIQNMFEKPEEYTFHYEIGRIALSQRETLRKVCQIDE